MARYMVDAVMMHRGVMHWGVVHGYVVGMMVGWVGGVGEVMRVLVLISSMGAVCVVGSVGSVGGSVMSVVVGVGGARVMDLLVCILRGGYLVVGRFDLMVDVLLVSVVVGSSVVVCVSVMGLVCAMVSVVSVRGAVAGGMDILDTVMGWVVDEVMSVMKTMAKMMRSVDSVVTSEVVCCVEAVFVGVVVCFSAVCSVVGGVGTVSMGSSVLVSGSVHVIRGLVDS